MSLSELFDFRIQRILWVMVFIALTNVFFHSLCVEGRNARMEFDEKGDVDTVQLLTNENNEDVVASASNIDRGYTYKYSHRFRLIDEIFKIPITVLQNVRDLLVSKHGY